MILSYAVKGGRVPAVVKRVADFLRINPVLDRQSGKAKWDLRGFHRGRGANPVKLARTAIKKDGSTNHVPRADRTRQQ